MLNIREEIKKGTKIEDLKFVNLNPHDVMILNKDGEIRTYPKSGYVARAENVNKFIGRIGDYDVIEASYTKIVGMPDPSVFGDDVVYIVSPILLEYNNSLDNPRTDFVAPETSPLSVVRDESGQIVATKGFVISINY